jgi:hypothetical protein
MTLVISGNEAAGQTRLSPSIGLAHRYDSNVLFGVAGPGSIKDDFVTTVTPQVTVTTRNPYFEGVVLGGLTAETYVNNPGLNYVGFHANLSLGLDRLVQQIDRSLKLSINEAVRFTPQLPAFFAPTDTGNALPPELVRGFQAARANSLSITHGATVQYGFTSNVNWSNTYNHSTLRFGSAFAQPGSGGNFFTTTYQSLTSTLTDQITAQDTIGMNYSYANADYGSGNTGISGFETHAGRLTYSRKLNPYWSASFAGGAILLPSQGPGTATTVSHVEDLTLSYKENLTGASLSYSRSILPSFGVGSVPLINETLSATLSQGFGPKWIAALSGYYGTAQSNPRGVLSYTSISGTASLTYIIRRDSAVNLLASASYTRQEFEQSFNNVGFAFDRDLAMFNLTAAWY